MTVEYLAVGQVLVLHEQQLRRYGGATGLRDRGALESALARPAATFGGEDLALTPGTRLGTTSMNVIIGSSGYLVT